MMSPLAALAPVDQRRHAAVHAVEAVRLAQEIGRRLRRAADARQLGHPVRRNRQLPERLDDRRGDRVVAAAGAERGDRAFVVAAGQPDRVLLQRRVVNLGLRDIGHAAFSSLAFTPRDHVMRAHREAAVVAHRLELLERHAGLELSRLRSCAVAVLLDDEVDLVRARGTARTSSPNGKPRTRM